MKSETMENELPKIDEKIRIDFHNLMTGEKRFEIWQKIETNIYDTFLAPNGHYYTQGVIGWMGVTRYIISSIKFIL
jgi:hypothetical protein